MLLLLFVLLFITLTKVCSQTEVYTTPDTSEEGLVYLLLIIFFAYNFTVPVLKYIYVFYVERIVLKVIKRLDETRLRISERISDAGRKASEQMKT